MNRRHFVTHIALGALLILSSLTLSQCTHVGDSLTGVQLNKAKPVSCKKQCDLDFKMLESQEKSLNKANLKACDKDDACIRAEKARHAAVSVQLNMAIKNCKASCHKQGSGTAG